MRLTDCMRVTIRNKLLEGKFDERISALMLSAEVIAEAGYKALYSPAIRKKIDELPDGWLPKSDSIRMEFWKGADGHCTFDFDGSDGHLYQIASSKIKRPEKAFRPFLFRHLNQVLLIDKGIGLYESYSNWLKMRNGIKSEHAKLSEDIYSALASATTTNALIKRWPEIEPILKKIAPKAATSALPVPQLKDLNKRLGLEKAA